MGSRLILRPGPTLETMQRLVDETGATAVFWNVRYEPAAIERDSRVKRALCDQGLDVQTFGGPVLFEPSTIRNKSTGRPFQVFTAFWKACLEQPRPAAPLPPPAHIGRPEQWPPSLPLKDLKLEPSVDWAGGIRAAWRPGEASGVRALHQFVNHTLHDYPSAREYPAQPGTSRLSPHLHFGELSPRTVWHTLQNAGNAASPASESYLRELGWREFAHHLLFHFPKTSNQPLRSEFELFPWSDDRRLVRAWQRGITGYPLVDAGMRELWATGWMHNRIRMVVASFLTKHLRARWDEGAYWFWDTLVDADLANNTLGWQWSAGCGADAAPYFRIFNPVRQGERFDPNGDYIRRWVPELSGLVPPWIHAPWDTPPLLLDEAGVKLGATYPLPIVAHAEARREALAAFDKMRTANAERTASRRP